MIPTRLLIVSICLAVTAFSAMVPAPAPAQPAAPVGQEQVKTVATFSILADLVKRVGGDRVSVRALVGPNSDSHVYAPTPDDARTIAAAQVIFANGLGFEGWIERLVRAAQAEQRLVIATAGLKPLPARKPNAHDGHGHSHDRETPPTAKGAAADPHAWQDVRNAKIYIANIRDALSRIDPPGAETYAANSRVAIAELDALDAEIRALLAPVAPERRRVITAHPAFDYFGAAYGVAFHARQGIAADSEVSARGLADLIRFIRREKVTAVFPENISDPRQLNQITKESGAAIGGTLYSDALSTAEGPAATYAAMMRSNAREIARALGAR